MIQVYWTKTAKIESRVTLSELLKDLPKDMQQKAFRYKNSEAAYQFAVGRNLLKKGLSQFGFEGQFKEIEFSEKDKPFIKGAHFNISHTQGIVICAFSNQIEIGIDIEKIDFKDLKNFESFFTGNEWNLINNSENPLLSFYRLWVKKESAIKLLGLSLKELNKIETPLESESLFFNGKKLFWETLDFGKEYCCSICTEAPQVIHYSHIKF